VGYPFTLACETTSRLFLKNFWRVVSQAFLGRLTTGVGEGSDHAKEAILGALDALNRAGAGTRRLEANLGPPFSGYSMLAPKKMSDFSRQPSEGEQPALVFYHFNPPTNHPPRVSSSSTPTARSYMAFASSCELPTAVSPVLPNSPKALIM
jgi:hypothetical protein